MPVRDGERHVGEAIESILGQTYSDLELLVVDDGSTDATPAVVGDFAQRDARIRVVQSRGSGLSAALNYGLELAGGEYVARMDADDIALPDRLARQVAFLDAHPDVAVVGGAWIVVDATGTSLGVVRVPTSSRAVDKELLHRNCISHPTVVMRTAVIRAAGGYRLHAGEDWDLWLRVAEESQLANLPEPVIRYRRHPGQLTIEALRPYALSSLAAVRAAQLRRAGKPDPLGADETVTRERLVALGVSRRKIEWALATAAATAVAVLEAVDRRSEADDIARRAVEEDAIPSRLLRSAIAVQRAKTSAAEGNRGAALVQLARAAIAQPLVPLRIVASRLSRLGV